MDRLAAPDVDVDVVVIGAGAAGLAAAEVLARAGRSVTVLEARGRLGGRMASVLDARSAVPMELGPEFVHGAPAVTLSRLRAAGTSVVDNADESWVALAGRQAEREDGDPFEAVATLLAGGRSRAPDESVDAFLARVPPGREALVRRTRALVGGFDAADPARASLRAIAEEWAGEASAEGTQSRPLGGYEALVRQLARALDPALVTIRTRSVVRAVASSGTAVRVEVARAGERAATIAARAAVVTVPLGVLQRSESDGGIRFEPPLSRAKTNALDGLVMGPVRKVVLLFATPFWERSGDARFRDAAFFHDEDGAFPTFWTQVPVRAPFVVAWAGGPAADALAERSDAEAVKLALGGFGRLVRDEAAARSAFVEAYTHDWQLDPFSRGAYSYVATGGEAARATLGALEGRLAFAGEATALGGEGGTVAGALLSGERAGREIAALLESVADVSRSATGGKRSGWSSHGTSRDSTP